MRLGNMLRTAGATLAAAAGAMVAVATARGSREGVELRPGDLAPDFTLPGSDGRTYRLSDFGGREAVVLAWFPKAFTGG